MEQQKTVLSMEEQNMRKEFDIGGPFGLDEEEEETTEEETKCAGCGTPIEEGDLYCRECGRKLEEKETETEEEGEKEEKKEEKTYTTTINCPKCNDLIDLEIPQDTSVKDFLKGKKCKNCKTPLS